MQKKKKKVSEKERKENQRKELFLTRARKYRKDSRRKDGLKCN